MSEAAERFCIQNDSMADWAIRKIQEARQDTEKWKAFYAERMAQVQAANEETIAQMEGYLAEYFDTVPHKATKTQESYQLPSGKLVLKAQQPEYVRDDAQLLPWAKENGYADCVAVKESVNWAELKKRLTVQGEWMIDPETGEAVPGITVQERGTKFSVEGLK